MKQEGVASGQNLFDEALDPRRMLPTGDDHLSTAVVHVEVVHEQAERLHIAKARQTAQHNAPPHAQPPESQLL